MVIALVALASAAMAGTAQLATPIGADVNVADRTGVIDQSRVKLNTAMAPGDLVNFDAAMAAGADYLQAMQADITDDNAGNGVDGVDEIPDDPDDGGWDWRVTVPAPFHHTTAASPKNIFGATAQGLYYAYLETGASSYFTALADAANYMIADAGVRSGADIVFLINYNNLAGVSGTAYMDSAKAKFDARVATYGSATAFAEYIRDVRAGQGYENGIIAWDIGVWARAAAMLAAEYPTDPYDYAQAADDIAEVIWQDSFNDNPGYFDIIDDAGFDPTWTDKNFWWYTLGLTGLIDAFDAAGVHTAEIPGLVTRLLASQYTGGGISGSYGANPDDEDWQSTAYAALSLGMLDQATYQDEINWMCYWLGATQDTSGGWVYSSNGNHYPEVGGECTAALYFSDNTLTNVIVDDDFSSQADVDAYNTAHGTNFVWGYDAFSSIQDAVDAVNGSTINVLPGTYEEQVVIDKDLDLVGSGAGATIIQSPTTLTEFFGTNYPIVLAQNADNVNIHDLTINGLGRGNSNSRFVGVGYNNAGGGIYDCEVLDIRDTPFSGAQHGVAIYTWNDDTVTRNFTVSGCDISGFQKNAMALNSSATTQLIVNVTGNTVTGYGPTDITAQNGIQVSGDVSTGTISGNTITGIAYDNTAATTKWVASSILNYYADVDVIGNTVSNAHVGLYNIDGSGQILENDITIEKIGVYAFGIIATDPPKAVPAGYDSDVIEGSRSDVKTRLGAAATLNVDVSRNTVTFSGTDNTATYGIEADAGWGPDDLAFAANNNFVNGFEVGIELYMCESGCDVGVFTSVAAASNSLVGNTYGVRSNVTYLTVDASGNWFGSTDPTVVAANVSGDVDYSPYLGSGTDSDPGTAGFQGDYAILYVDDDSPQFGSLTRLIEAIGLLTNSTIYLAPGTYPEGPQVVIDKDVTIIGDSKNTVTIVPTANTGSVGDPRGWFLVQDGNTFNLSEVTLDGSGYNVYQAIRSAGAGTVDNTIIKNISYSTYVGLAAAVFGNYNMTFSNNVFENIQRVGVLFFGTGLTGSEFSGNTYTGKGDGDWLDYAVEIGAGAVVDILGNTISGNTGVASSDGSTSAGILVTTYYGTGSTANCDGNDISDCSAGIAIGYDASDASTVVLTDNTFVNNDYGVTTTASTGISLTAYGNYFSNTVNATDDAGGTWDDGVSQGNCWSDFTTNTNYPTSYLVGGSAGAVDSHPNTGECGVGFDVTELTYDCSGTFTYDVVIDADITGMEVGAFTIVYPSDVAYVGVTAATSNFSTFTSVFAGDPGNPDTVIVDFTVLSGSLDGPATLFTVEMSGSTDICTGDYIHMAAARYRTAENVDLYPPIGVPIYFVADCADPAFVINGPADGGYYNVAPVLDVAASDNCELDAVYYQYDGCDGASWTAIASGIGSTSYNNSALTAPDFGSLSEGSHCLYFKATDVNGRGNADSCTLTWCFTKDVTAPAPPTDFTAEPGHNKVKLSWTNPGDPDVIGIKVQRVAWSDYPEYATPPAYPADQSTGTTVFNAFGTSHTDVLNLSNTTRDVYYYGAFAYDQAGNYSVAAASAQDRSTSYWLGDLTDASTGAGAYDGYVYFGDLARFSITYNKASGDVGFDNEADFGPSHNNSPKGIPVPDDSVGFEDLAIFAINFDAVNPTMKTVPLFADAVSTGPLKLVLEAEDVDGSPVYHLSIANNVDQLKAFHVVMEGSENAAFQGVKLSEALNSETPMFTDVALIEGKVVFDFAILGKGVTVGGSGRFATFSFASPDGSLPQVNLVEGLVRDADNNQLAAQLQSVSFDGMPTTYALSQNYPNPFNPTTKINFDLPQPGEVTLEVFNMLGQRVAVLVDEYLEAGSHTVEWDSRDEYGDHVASGIYLYRLNAGDVGFTRKMMLLK
jgi:hypothetical protein